MGLRDLFSRWSKGEDERAIERAEEESQAHVSSHERAVDHEDYEGRKEDLYSLEHDYPGAEAAATADEDLRD